MKLLKFINRILIKPIPLILIVWVIFSSPFLFQGKLPLSTSYLVSFFPPWNASYGMPTKNNAMPDIFTQIYPWKKIAIDNWKHGQIPLWNPYSFAGTQLGGNYQSAVFTPLNIIFYIFSFEKAFSLLVLLQPLIAGIGMYRYLKLLQLKNPLVISYGSVTFMFMGFVTVWMGYQTLVYAVIFLPYILSEIEFSKIKLRINSFINISLFVALSLLAGHFQMSLYLLIFTCLYILFMGNGIRIKIYLILGILTGILISFPQLLLAFNAFNTSIRGLRSVSTEVIPWKYLITLFAPDYFGNPVTRNDWFGHYAEWSSFVGTIGIFNLFFINLFNKKRIIFFYLICAVLTLLLSTPNFINSLIFKLNIPVLSSSASSRIVYLFSFSLIILSSFGFDNWIKQNNLNKLVSFRILILLLVVIIIWSLTYFKLIVPSEYFNLAKRNLILPTLIVICAIIATIIKTKIKILNYLVIITILFLSFFDVIRFSLKWLPYDESNLLYPKNTMIDYLNENIGNFRVVGNFGGEVTNYFKIQGLEGYDALYSKRYGEIIGASFDGNRVETERSIVNLPKNGVYSEKLLQLLGIRYIVHRKSDFHHPWTYPFWNFENYKQVYSNDHYEIYQNNNTFDRIYALDTYKVIESDDNLINQFYDDNTNFKEVVLLEKDPGSVVKGDIPQVYINRFKDNFIDFNVKLDSPKVIFISNSYDKGWKSYDNNEKIEVLRANYAFQAVRVPSGEHNIKLIYKPDYFALCIILSTIILLFEVIAIIKYRKL